MPLIKREVQPVNLSRGSIAKGIHNELECVTNNSLANVIHQLSSLSKHAEDMFGELFNEANAFFQRANHLQERVERLKVKVTQLDSTVEEVSLQDINMRKPFRGANLTDQQVVSRRTMPVAMQETYHRCDQPPPLAKLNIYREDGKDSMKFYTDPSYFFELWLQEMQKDTEQKKEEYIRKRKKQRPRAGGTHSKKPREIKTRKEYYEKFKDGVELADNTRQEPQQRPRQSQQHNRPDSLQFQQQHNQQRPPSSANSYYSPRMSQMDSGSTGPVPEYHQPPPYDPQRGARNTRSSSMLNSGRPMQPPPQPPPQQPAMTSPQDLRYRGDSGSRESLPPPPPPPPFMQPMNTAENNTPSSPDPVEYRHLSPGRPAPKRPSAEDLPPPPPPPPIAMMNGSGGIPQAPPTPPPPMPDPAPNMATNMAPPPPPPPPPPGMNTGSVEAGLAPPDMAPDEVSLTSTNSSITADNKTQPVRDERSDLLSAIRQGFKLRKVEERKMKEEQKQANSGSLDVQSIMDKAFEMRRKALEASDSEEEEWEDGGEWGSDDD
ncbi:wiskott-Aldrich syndrome protein family member 2 isoform X2 [Lingula anatina]|uniref:Wiskott-Aldrich syndrome protein family member n=1 Tax=Lingula anatina TaxID=7574 RepID=A0A1S3JL94_LINAN|nr:wiskott-Aldrich syndrome protein family member 2 isoform X2 [Lingula anatina]|eukprot:XP_013410911.1 wiskott-Aldrich syndrome protein family member 2 isoform X2 [Lingula anatina]